VAAGKTRGDGGILLQGRREVHGRVEGGNHILRSGKNQRGRVRAGFPMEGAAAFSASHDPREVFADWLITPKNQWFTRNIANRVWSWLLGHGIIHEPDDIRADNPPSNPELLAYLETRTHHRQLRSQEIVPTDSQFADLPARLRATQ
jgi:hypothetical protein